MCTFHSEKFLVETLKSHCGKLQMKSSDLKPYKNSFIEPLCTVQYGNSVPLRNLFKCTLHMDNIAQYNRILAIYL